MGQCLQHNRGMGTDAQVAFSSTVIPKMTVLQMSHVPTSLLFSGVALHSAARCGCDGCQAWCPAPKALQLIPVTPMSPLMWGGFGEAISSRYCFQSLGEKQILPMGRQLAKRHCLGPRAHADACTEADFLILMLQHLFPQINLRVFLVEVQCWFQETTCW